MCGQTVGFKFTLPDKVTFMGNQASKLWSSCAKLETLSNESQMFYFEMQQKGLGMISIVTLGLS